MRTLLSQAPTSRVGRYPKHTYHVKHSPWVIQPFMIARVQPGETLNTLHCESRSVMRSLPNPILGWKLAHYYFYVRATDLMLDEFKAMFTDPANTSLISSTTLEDASGNAATYCAPGAIDWTLRCVQRITEHYFRDEGKAWDNWTDSTSGLPLAQVRENTWLDSVTESNDMPEGAAISGATDAGDLDRLMDAFNNLRAIGLAPMTYEDWLRSQGIPIPEKDEGKPELLYMKSEFTYPTNTIDPTDGTPVSAISMAWKKTHDDPKFFKEPGFVVGIAVLRPKVYFGGLAGSLCGFADRAWDWSPNYLRDMPETTLKEFANGTGPIPARTGDGTQGYFVDMRDELLHGDQFVYLQGAHWVDNFNSVIADHKIAEPYYGDLTDYKFDSNESFSALAIETDGYASFNISGFEVDYTPGNFAEQ